MWKTQEYPDNQNKAFIIKYFKTFRPFEGVRIANVVVTDYSKKNHQYTIENLENNEFYSVGVTAVNNTDMGPISNIVQITPQQNKQILTKDDNN